MLNTVKNYVKYSGVTITLTLNPLQWKFIPRVTALPEFEKWAFGENYLGLKFEFLLLRVVVEIDDGYPDNGLF